MKSNSVVHATALSLNSGRPRRAQSVSGAPTTGSAAIGVFSSLEVGVWEMSPGVMTDVEADEIFVVLSGAATVEFADDNPALTLGPGDVVQLSEGAQTVWTVTETLRKVYLT